MQQTLAYDFTSAPEELKELTPDEIVELVLVNEGKGVSHNRLKNSECLHAFHEQYVLGRKDEASEAAEFGGFVHDLSEKGFKQVVDPSQIANEVVKDYPLVPGWRIGEAVYMARNALARIDGRFGVDVEKYFVKELLNIEGKTVNLNGRIDRLELNPWTPKVIDLKTGIYTNPAKSFQLPLYTWGADFDEATGVLHFLRYDEWAEIPITRDRIEESLEWARRQVNRIYEACMKNEWPASEGENCKYCSFRDTCTVVGQRYPANINEAVSIANEVFTLKERVSTLEGLLKAYVEKHGTPVPINVDGGEGKVFDFSPSNEYEADFLKALDFCIERGIPLQEVFSINYRGVKKYLPKGLDAAVKVKPATPRFGVKSKFTKKGQ